MNATTTPVGIDCGETQLRAAYGDAVVIVPVPLPGTLNSPSILCDTLGQGSGIGVTFPSILRSLGSRRGFSYGNRTETPESLFEQRFIKLHELVAGRSGKVPGQAVLAVPATLSDHRRRVLLDCAVAGGFAAAELVDQCTAAAIGHKGSQDVTATVLVFHLGYSDCEFSLIRLTKGRCHVLGVGSVAQLSAQALDELTLEAIVLALRTQSIFLGLKKLPAARWLELRGLAEEAWQKLVQQRTATVLLDPELTQIDRQIEIRMNHVRFRELLKPMMDKAVDEIHVVLEQGKLDACDLDAFLIVGSGAETPFLRQAFADAFDTKPTVLKREIVALGATLRALQRMGQSVEGEELLVLSDSHISANGTSVQSDASAAKHSGTEQGFAEIVSLADEPEPRKTDATRPHAVHARGAPNSGENALAHAERLIADGREEEALDWLDRVIDQAESLRGKLGKNRLTGAQVLIEQARALVNGGRLVEAVALSHQAFDADRDDPGVFAAMMNIHADAALRMDAPEEYTAALQVLQCAHGHDQTNRSIHQALARRHFMHAVAMRNRNNIELSLEALEKALRHDPKNAEVLQLFEELSASP